MKVFCITILFVFISLSGRAQITMPAASSDTLKAFDHKVPGMFYYPSKFRSKEVKPLPPNIYTQNFGFFCKQELKMHNAHVPLSFRLGSMEYCNMLEQK